MSTISCAEFERLLDEAVESRLETEAGPWAEHAASCAACGEMWQQSRLVNHAVAAWLARTPQADLAESVLARFAFERDQVAAQVANDAPAPLAARANPHRTTAAAAPGAARPRVRGLAAVAVAVLAFATWAMFRSADHATNGLDNGKGTSVATSSSSTHVTTTDANVEQDELESLVQNAGSAYLVLARDAADAVVDASRMVAPTERLTVVLAGARDDAESHPRQPKEPNAAPKPIGRQFGEALQFLFDAEPPEAPPSA